MNKATAIASARFGLGAGARDDPGGDPKAWLKSQLQGPDPGLASGAFAGLLTGGQAVDALRAEAQAHRAFLLANPGGNVPYRNPLTRYFHDEAVAQLGFAATTPASFRERLVWFWANHFSVSAQQNQAGVLAGPMLREAIRPHVTGHFTDMVLAVESHPAMLRYLDNINSIGPDSPIGQRTGKGLNENLGRECMELHTVGLAAGYSQADVTNMAKILTGWSVAPSDEVGVSATGFKYRPFAHEPGPQTVLGRRFGGGERAGIEALTFLSTYPSTYNRLARQLVIHFVADEPPPRAVAHIAGVLRDTRGDLGAASAALVDLPEAWRPGQKLKTPFEYVISTVRAAPVPAGQKPPELLGSLNQLGQPLWGAPLPNGWSDQAADWVGADAVMVRINWAYTYSGRFDDAGVDPMQLADNALGPLLRAPTRQAMGAAGSPREAMTLFLASPEFLRR